jgi:sarcosine oxidase, subunit beta
MPSPDVAIIGAGVIGASIAFHLASRGCTNVLVLDRERVAEQGSTGRATGGYRAQFGSEINVRLSLLSRKKLRRFEADTGVDPGYRPTGYLFLAQHKLELEALLRAQVVQRAAGLDEVRRVEPDEVRDINPAVACPTLGGVFCPSDGFIRPREILRGYTEGARRLGVRFDRGRPCTGMHLERGTIRFVRTPSGDISVGCVVNAAGAWAAVVADYAGVRLPVRPLRRQVAATHPTDLLPEDMPMTIFVADGFHLRVRDGRVLLLLPDEPKVDDPFDTAVDDGWVRTVVARAHQRLPILRDAPIDRQNCWAGLYEMSPDSHVILGRAPRVENLFLANGSSGHGVMHAPAIGQLLAEIILDGGARSLNTHLLRPARFDESDPVAGAALL